MKVSHEVLVIDHERVKGYGSWTMAIGWEMGLAFYHGQNCDVQRIQSEESSA
jgi:hypothetical protein